MLDLVRELRGRGLRTALLSNSWGGKADGYPRDVLDELFDVAVISGRGRHAQAGGTHLQARRRPARPAAGRVRVRRRRGGQHHGGQGARLRGRRTTRTRSRRERNCPSCWSPPSTSLTGMPEQSKAAYPHPSTPGRSANMKANRRTDTKPELALRKALHAKGYRYRKDLGSTWTAGFGSGPTSCLPRAGSPFSSTVASGIAAQITVASQPRIPGTGSRSCAATSSATGRLTRRSVRLAGP